MTLMCRTISLTALAILLPLYGKDRDRGDFPFSQICLVGVGAVPGQPPR
jgi:hypothetical protein